MILLISILIAVIVSIPWFIAGRPKGGSAVLAGSCLVALFCVYFFTPSSAGPFLGGFGLIAALLLIPGLFTLRSEDHRGRIPGYFSTGVWLMYAITAICSSTMFRAQDYAALVPPIHQREWSKDFQPKDPRHFRVSSAENALYLAGRAIGQATTLDSHPSRQNPRLG
jgi:hypothetical protein